MNTFWMNPSIYYYIQTIELILANARFARSSFLNYITETKEDGTMDEKRKDFLSLLMKLNSDLLFFLTSKPTVNAMWWNMCNLYCLINRVWKSLCEGNFQEAKIFCGTFVAKSKWDSDFNQDGMSIVAFKMEELIFLLRSSMICENTETTTSKSDQDLRLIPMLKPVLICLNEMVCGPCRQNIKIVLEFPNLYIYNIFSRQLDDMNHQFYELNDCLVIFMLSLCEGFDPEVLKMFAKN